MPVFEHNGASIYYEEYGSGYPLLLFAPGGMKSNINVWRTLPTGAPSPFDPTKEFASDFRVIAMDQRNAGRSRGPVSASDGWHTYTADHLALLDHLGIRRCHVMGGCIGSSYCMGIIKAAPDRVSAAVLQNPIGLHENRHAFYEMFDTWAKELKSERTDVTDAALASFRENMYGGDFVFTVTRDFMRACQKPVIVLSGSDLYHPAPISKEISEIAPKCDDLVMEWKSPEAAPKAVARIREFLKKYQPA